jgi:WD40-like Beta Propeller Repeat
MRFASLVAAGLALAPCFVIAACFGDDPVTATPDAPDGATSGTPDGSGTDSAASDAAGPGSDAADAAKGPCRVDDPFDPPVLVGSVNASNFIDRGARLSPDETTMYFASTRPGDDRVYFAVRQTPTSAFLAPTILLSDGQDNDNPTVTADGKTLFVNRTSTLTAGAENVHIYTRPDPTGIFSNDALVNVVSGPSGSKQPYVLPDGSALYFSTGGTLRTSMRVGSAFAAPTDVIPTPSGSGYSHPVVTDDELALWFSSEAGVHLTTRKSRSDQFGAPKLVTELSTKLPARPTWISPDRCAMYLTIAHVLTPPGVADETHIFRATRKPR